MTVSPRVCMIGVVLALTLFWITVLLALVLCDIMATMALLIISIHL